MVLEPAPPLPHWPGLAGRSIAWARAEDIVTAPLRRIFAWWTAQADHGPPQRAAFDVTEFGDVAENLYIIAAVPDGFELRLAGEEYIRLFGLRRGWVWRFD